MKPSSLKINKNGTIRATGAAANALFHAMTDPQPDNATPRPWDYSVDEIYVKRDGKYHLVASTVSESFCEKERRANAALIVKAVNEYAALLESEIALGLALEALESLAEQVQHGDALCEDGHWHTQFCQENGCVMWRIERAKQALANLAAIRGQKAGGK